MTAYIISALIGYLFGSFPTAYLLVKWKSNVDIRQAGSGNVGTLNTMEVTGSKGLGVAVMIVDVAKGALPVLIVMNLFGSQFSFLGTAGLSSIAGHSFSMWLRFKGGRGLATTVGVMLVLGWIFIVIWLTVWSAGYLMTRNVHWSNILASLLSPVIVGIMPETLAQILPPYTTSANLLHFSVAFCALIVITHREVIEALVKKQQTYSVDSLLFMKKFDIPELKEMARQIRRDIIKMLLISKSGHSGGPLGLADIFACLYFDILKIDPQNLRWEGRDYFFLSAGHLCPVWYATLARRGFIPLQELTTLRKIDGRLQGHPAPPWTHGVPGAEVASGALGQGLSIAVGCALGLRLDNKPNRVYVVHGDGELDEGQIWEAAMTAAHHHVDSLIAIVDRNNCQIDNFTDKVMNLEPLADKWRAFGWQVFECDGNNIEEFLKTMKQAQQVKGRPSMILAHTFMGKGVSFMENDYRWHGVPPNEEQGKQALSELAPTKFGDFIEFEWEKQLRESSRRPVEVGAK